MKIFTGLPNSQFSGYHVGGSVAIFFAETRWGIRNKYDLSEYVAKNLVLAL